MANTTNITKLKAIIDTLSSNILGASYAYLETEPTAFPAAMIWLVSQDEEFYDTNNSLVTYTYNVRVQFADQEGATAYAKWLSFIDELSAALRTKANSTFDGTALMARLVTLDPSYSDADSTVPVAFYDVQVEVKMLKSIT